MFGTKYERFHFHYPCISPLSLSLSIHIHFSNGVRLSIHHIHKHTVNICTQQVHSLCLSDCSIVLLVFFSAAVCDCCICECSNTCTFVRFCYFFAASSRYYKCFSPIRLLLLSVSVAAAAAVVGDGDVLLLANVRNIVILGSNS